MEVNGSKISVCVNGGVIDSLQGEAKKFNKILLSLAGNVEEYSSGKTPDKDDYHAHFGYRCLRVLPMIYELVVSKNNFF